MRKKVILVLITVSVILSLAACAKTDVKEITPLETNETEASGFMQQEITENMNLDIRISSPQVQSAKTYEVTGRNFNIEEAAKVWNLNLGNANYFINELSGNEFFEGADGWEINGGNGSFTYFESDEMYELVDNIKFTYEEQLQNFTQQDMAEISGNESIMYAQNVLESIYKPVGDEALVLTKVIEVKSEDLRKYQEELIQDGVVTGDGKTDLHLVSERVCENMYYLSFGVMLEGIKEADQDDLYGFMVADMDKNTSRLTIDMIVEDGTVTFLYISDAFQKQESEDNVLISVQSAVDVLKAKYELEIIPSEQIINEAYLEYVFVDDAGSDDEYKGKLVPYWCFNNETSQCSDRINAITGEDFQYE